MAAADGPKRRRKKIRKLKILIIQGSGGLGDEIRKGIESFHLPNTDMEIFVAGPTRAEQAAEGAPGKYLDVEIDKTESIANLLRDDGYGPFDHIICCGGSIGSVWRPLVKCTRAHYESCFASKVLGQIDLVIQAAKKVTERGSITLTSGVLERLRTARGHGIASANGAISAFVRAAALEMPRDIRLNAVSPGVAPKLVAGYPELFAGFHGTESKDVCQAYLRCLFGPINGTVVEMVTGSHFTER